MAKRLADQGVTNTPVYILPATVKMQNTIDVRCQILRDACGGGGG